jgi:hypothetical protein
MNNTLKLFAVAVGGTVVGVTAMSFDKEAPAPTQPVVEKKIDALPKASKDCLDLVAQVGAGPYQCEIGEAYLDNDKVQTAGWICNGAYMPKVVQDCLNDAAKMAETEAKAEVGTL